MAINFPGPGELRIFYQTNEPSRINNHVLRHSFRFTSDPPTVGLNFASYDADMRGGSTVDLEAWTDALIDLIKAMFHTSTDFTHAELWYYDAGTFDSVFVSTYPIAVAGTSATATSVASQSIITMRSQNGGIAKFDMRGQSFAPAPSEGFPTAQSLINNLAAALVSGLSIMVARDGGFVFAPIKWLPGQNEHAWKLVNR